MPNQWRIFIVAIGIVVFVPPHEVDCVMSSSVEELKIPYVIVLGIAQDAGYPQAGCDKSCCMAVHEGRAERQYVSCIAVVDPESNQRWLFDATPDFREQLRLLDELAPPKEGSKPPALDGIFLTHAHIGHFTGLMFVGHESIGAQGVPTYVMPRMHEFLSTHGPWSQLVEYENISLRTMNEAQPIQLNERVSVTPIRVPHREEFSEVVCFRIDGPGKSVLFVPDIDKWDTWEHQIEEMIASVDLAYIDGTFFSGDELPGRDMSAIPHPFISESIARLRDVPLEQRQRIRFIHLNHSNPAIDPDSEASKTIRSAGMSVAQQGERVAM